MRPAFRESEGGLISAETISRCPTNYDVANLQAEQRLANAAEVDSILSVRLPTILRKEAYPEN